MREIQIMKDSDTQAKKRVLSILLLTNRDSDNVGDQMIEACDISIIHTIMKNLGYSESEYKISSRACGIISKQYLRTLDEKYLTRTGAIEAIKNADLIIFGGAPVFNFAYQAFYKRTIITLELAKKYNTPVVFSSIGVEKYSPYNKKCQELKRALNSSSTTQATTRDDIVSLRSFIEKDGIATARVSDPVVLADKIFESYKVGQTKTIGLAVVRSGIFKDNTIDYSEEQQLLFWKQVIDCISEKGYSYKCFTTGHFSDEIFLNVLQRRFDLPAANCVYNMNNPETLVGTISSCCGIVAFRLHANITAFALNIPAIGLTWNQKIPLFYESIGYKCRAFEVDNFKPEIIVAALEKAISDGVKKDKIFVESVYSSLFSAMKQVFCPNVRAKAYTGKNLTDALVTFKGTSKNEQLLKLDRKFRRIYENYDKIKKGSR